MAHVVPGAGHDLGEGFFLIPEDGEIGKLSVLVHVLLVVLGNIPPLPGEHVGMVLRGRSRGSGPHGKRHRGDAEGAQQGLELPPGHLARGQHFDQIVFLVIHIVSSESGKLVEPPHRPYGPATLLCQASAGLAKTSANPHDTTGRRSMSSALEEELYSVKGTGRGRVPTGSEWRPWAMQTGYDALHMRGMMWVPISRIMSRLSSMV